MFLILQSLSTQLLPFLMIVIPYSVHFHSKYISLFHLNTHLEPTRMFLLKSPIALCSSYSTTFLLAPHCPHIYSKSCPCRQSHLLQVQVLKTPLFEFSSLFLEMVTDLMFLLFLSHFLFHASLCKTNIHHPSSYVVFWALQLVSPSHAAPVVDVPCRSVPQKEADFVKEESSCLRANVTLTWEKQVGRGKSEAVTFHRRGAIRTYFTAFT